MKMKWTMGLMIGAIGLVVTGCTEKLTYERFQTVHDGASRDAVEATLGRPWEIADQVWVYNDSDRSITATIYFDNGKVIGKKWADPERGIEGSSPLVGEPGDDESIDIQRIQ